MKNLVLYTTIYPGVEQFLKDWYRSVMKQTDRNFQLWVGLDGLKPDNVKDTIGVDVDAIWVECVRDDTPAQIRMRALEQIVEICDGVILVDSDDVLHPSRVAAARVNLSESSLNSCALRLVDLEGRDLGHTLCLSQKVGPNEVLPRNNVYGFSNSAYRSDLLRQCLPIHRDTVLVDWFLATRAWLQGAKLSFDPIVRMDYRQYGANMVQTVAPFTVDQIAWDTERVQDHFRLIQTFPPVTCLPDRLVQLKRIASDVDCFYRRVVLEPKQLNRYVKGLNCLVHETMWWSSVAHPAFRHLWATERN